MTTTAFQTATDVRSAVINTVASAKEAARRLSRASTEQKNLALAAMAKHLHSQRPIILKANAKDVQAAQTQGLSSALIDRLRLNEQRLSEMETSIEAVIALPDPVGEVLREWRRPNGLSIHKVRVPLGVIGIIYESRPNVTSECASLCVKSGNAVVLRGGSESFHSNQAIGAAPRRCRF